MSQLSSLPVDTSQILPQEKEIIDILFKKEDDKNPIQENFQTIKTNMNQCSKLYSEVKEGLWVVLLFLIFTMQFTDDCIKKWSPFKSDLIIYIFKILIIVILYWLFKNFSLLFKK